MFALIGCNSSGTAANDVRDPPIDSAAAADAAATADAAVATPSVRFIVMGDTGEGNADQKAVADAIESKCAVDGCDFVLLLGDNIYDDGVTGTSDRQWQTKFEEPYARLDLPFYAVLGNHDYGGSLSLGPFEVVDTPGIGNEWHKGPIEVQYTQLSEKWTMPATHYTVRFDTVGFVMLDTNSMLWNDTTHGDQRNWYANAVRELKADGAQWILGAGHHTYRSNGTHGNAGNYESIEVAGVDVPNPVPILNGAHVKTFFDQHVCGTLDVYFCGHDHNRQWLNAPQALCGTELIVSGAGAKVKDFRDGQGTPAYFQDADTEGFMYVVIEGDTFTGQFIDKFGMLNFERSFTRRGAAQ